MQRKITTIAGSILLALLGVSAIALSREYFARLILGAASRAAQAHTQVTKYKEVRVYYPSVGALLFATEQIDMHGGRAMIVHQLVRAWLAVLASERITKELIALQSSSITQPSATALLSFNGHFLLEDWSTKQKRLCIKSLIKTLQSAKVSAVQLLCNHEPMSDPHIDLSALLPVDG